MLLSVAIAHTLLAGLTVAAPFSLPNGFPTPNNDALHQIFVAAGGSLPNTPLPTTLPSDAVTTLQVIAYNEIFEVAFFSSFLNNVTNGVEGFTDLPMDKSYIVDILTAVVNQESLHAIGANGILASANATTIPACNYMFPSTDFESAVAIADLFTAVVLGTLQSVVKGFATDMDNSTIALTGLIASIIGQEGEQAGGYRMIQGKIPSAAPFLTVSTGEFAFNAIAQTFIVPGSCDSVFKTIGVPMLDTLAVVQDSIQPTNQTVTFTTSCTHVTEGKDFVAYLSGQNAPVLVPVTNVQVTGDIATFSADLPFDNGFAHGLTIAAVVGTDTGLETAADVTAAAFAGPGLIQVN
ncbi:putative sexual development protein [Kockovaella imperatae]|uniref:Putative sexual development protein n=1 Tax=Kockovaella imperatae TaxID=4999 RepID=A0A1Y1U8F3_9TREE|nr:putative sexual development protein [Kockovaella imperatae]ORX34319.1 putative sexual development protein [Kockovaella imperatae]